MPAAVSIEVNRGSQRHLFRTVFHANLMPKAANPLLPSRPAVHFLTNVSTPPQLAWFTTQQKTTGTSNNGRCWVMGDRCSAQGLEVANHTTPSNDHICYRVSNSFQAPVFLRAKHRLRTDSQYQPPGHTHHSTRPGDFESKGRMCSEAGSCMSFWTGHSETSLRVPTRPSKLSC